ncbi:hypothetical protein EW145_g8402, partial [Phellinidium pouzarii]
MDTSGDWGEVNAAVEDASSNKPKLRTRNEAAQSNKKRLENETPERRIQRERREKAAEEKQVPGKRGARVYEWLESETSAGVLVRMAVSRASVEDTWDNYRVSQKCYDGFHDEWDLCDGFDPAPRNYGPPTDEFDKDDDNWDVPAVTGQAFVNGLDALGPNDLVEDLLQQGVTVMVADQQPIFRLVRSGRRRANTFFLSVVEANKVEKALQDELMVFTQDIINSNGSLARLRNRFHDLHPTSLALAPSLWNQNFVINVLKQRVETEDPANRTRMIVVDTFIYVLRPKVRGVPWLVAVLDPVAALEWLRLGRDSVWDGCCHFIARGVPFHTLTEDRPADLNAGHIGIHDLGWRKTTRSLNSVDYLTYERTIVDFLKSSSRARAAIMAGGIVWRLAMYHLGLDDAIDAVMTGPAGDFIQPVYTMNTVDGAAPTRNQTWWDDRLTEEEERLVCGVYKMYIGDDVKPEST